MEQKSRQGRYITLAGAKLLPADITDISALTLEIKIALK